MDMERIPQIKRGLVRRQAMGRRDKAESCNTANTMDQNSPVHLSFDPRCQY